MLHELKIARPFADAVLEGRKTFELRRNDRGFQAGDEVAFKPLDEIGALDPFHPLNRKRYIITYVLNGYGLENGYVAFAISEDIG